MKLNKSTTLSKIQAEIKALRLQEYKCLHNDDFAGAKAVTKEIQNLKNELLEMLELDGV